MSITELMDKLSAEAVLLEPGKISACGKMLTLIESIEHPAIEHEKKRLKDYLETMIMQDLEGGSATIEDVTDSVEKIQKILREKMTIQTETSVTEEEFFSDGGETVTEAEETAEKTDACEEDINESGDNQPAQEETAQVELEDFIVEDVDLLMDFISEAREHLDSIELNMVKWERNPEEKEVINSIFRPFHTIKGVAGFLNLKTINSLSHELENLLDEARENRIQLTPELSDLIFDGVDILKSLIASHETSVQNNQPVSYSVDVEAFLKKVTLVLNSSLKVPDDGEEVIPVKQEPLGEILVKDGKIKEDDIKDVLEKQTSAETKKPVGEMLIEENKVSARDVRDAIRKQSEAAKVKVEKHIKVDTRKMDQLLDMVGELVIAQSIVTHNPEVMTITNQRFIRDISQLTRVTSTLQNISMSMRLVPIGVTFQKMNRIVRDLSRKSGKKINLVLEGQSAEIDRNMVEELYDPLVHMVRNSCDHGIQTPDKRVAAGKPPEGTVTLKAEHAGGKIVITISDDGKGLDRDVILKKARDKGLWTGDERPDDKTIDNFIFAAGFSTAKKITDVSGRGVGLDVVKKALEKLHGIAEITSGKGVGTTFTIKLPLTTAIIDGMLVNIGDNRFIIPTLSVRQLVHPVKKDITSVIGKGETVMVRGRLLPLFRLNNILGIECEHQEPWNAVLVIVEDNGKEIAFQVDSVLDKQEVVIKNLGEKYNDQKCVAGGAILGDGRVGLILDIRSITSSN